MFWSRSSTITFLCIASTRSSPAWGPTSPKARGSAGVAVPFGKFYDIERDINGQPADVRHAAGQKLSLPNVTGFFGLSEQQLLRIPGKSDLAKAFRYGLAWQQAFSLSLADGRVAIDNNPAESARRLGWNCKKKLALCRGRYWRGDSGAETLARAMTVVETAKLNGLTPLACLADVLERIHDHKINRMNYCRGIGRRWHPKWTVKPRKLRYQWGGYLSPYCQRDYDTPLEI